MFCARTSGTDGTSAELLVAPVRDSRGKPVISTQKALTELVRQTREQTEYGALQTSWAGWCAAHINPAIQRGTRREEPAPETIPERPAPGSFDAICDAIRQADLSEAAAERLEGLLRLKVEVVRHRRLESDYTAPEAALRVSQLHPPVGRPPDPWPFIEAVRAPAHAILETAMTFGLGLGRTDPHYRDGMKDFPEIEDRIRLASVVARCALLCARTEAMVKDRLYGTRTDDGTCWPQGARKELVRHGEALEAHLASRKPKPVIWKRRFLHDR